MLYGSATPAASRPIPNYSEIDLELRRKRVTLQLLWQEYKERTPDGYEYKSLPTACTIRGTPFAIASELFLFSESRFSIPSGERSVP